VDISKSIRVALAIKEMQKQELATAMKVSPQAISALCKSKTCSGDRLIELCRVFEMKASDFIVLGE